MTNAHYHRGEDTFLSMRGEEFRFVGMHPWTAESAHVETLVVRMREELERDVRLGVGEIGLDRLRTKTVTSVQRSLLTAQLKVAADLRRPVVLHGARCWGEVVEAVKPFAGRIPLFLFHGFSRSGGLISEIVALNGFVSVGKAILNDHAVNYRRLISGLPTDRLLVETDDAAATEQERDSLLPQIFAKVSELTGLTERQMDVNCERLIETLACPVR